MTERKGENPPAARSNEGDHPLANCALHQRATRGKTPNYSYPENSPPKTKAKSAPAMSLIGTLSKAKAK